MILTPRHRRTARRGFAPLELTIAVPMLLLMAAFIYKLVDFGLVKAWVNVTARKDAWAKRSGTGRAESSPLPQPSGRMTALRTASSTPRGLVKVDSSREFRMAPLVSGRFDVRGSHAVLGDTFDHKTVAFKDRKPFQFDDRLVKVFGQSLSGLDKLANPAGASAWAKQAGRMLLEGLAKQAIAGTEMGKALDKINKIKEAKEKAKKKKGGLGGFLESIGGAIGDVLGIPSPSDWGKILDAIPKAKGVMKSTSNMLDMMKANAPPT